MRLKNDSIIYRAKKGDVDAFSRLMKDNKAYIYKIAYKFMKNEQEALEIVQETSCKAFIKINTLKNEEFFKTWITKIVINECINAIKKNKKVEYLNSEKNIHSEKIISLEEKLDLYNAIDKLNEKYKTVIILKYFNDLTTKDISYVMGIPENTVKSHLRRAKNELNRLLGEDYLYEYGL